VCVYENVCVCVCAYCFGVVRAQQMDGEDEEYYERRQRRQTDASVDRRNVCLSPQIIVRLACRYHDPHLPHLPSFRFSYLTPPPETPKPPNP
jgi:hypothetical protein